MRALRRPSRRTSRVLKARATTATTAITAYTSARLLGGRRRRNIASRAVSRMVWAARIANRATPDRRTWRPSPGRRSNRLSIGVVMLRPDYTVVSRCRVASLPLEFGMADRDGNLCPRAQISMVRRAAVMMGVALATTVALVELDVARPWRFAVVVLFLAAFLELVQGFTGTCVF